jgi:glutathione peroxidase
MFMEAFYKLRLQDINGKEIDFGGYLGMVLLIMNSACKCGFAKGSLEMASRVSREMSGVKVLLFPGPLNALVNQEFETPEEIKKFLKDYPGDYDLFPISVASKNPVFSLLNKSVPSLLPVKTPLFWNFTKFVVDREGNVRKYLPVTNPKKVEKKIKRIVETNQGRLEDPNHSRK